jgi:hypothetical protein
MSQTNLRLDVHRLHDYKCVTSVLQFIAFASECNNAKIEKRNLAKRRGTSDGDASVVAMKSVLAANIRNSYQNQEKTIMQSTRQTGLEVAMCKTALLIIKSHDSTIIEDQRPAPH